MFFKMIKNDIKKNPGNNLVLLLFMTLSVGLIATVILMICQLFTSISTLYETAKPPHFLQMHKGELNQAELDEFNQSYPNIEHWQTVEMINIYGDQLTVKSSEEFTLADCRLDISLVKQNSSHDLLLDENRELVQLEKGQIGVPVILLEKYPIEIGDKILLESRGIQKEFIVANFIYDGQMNSTLCSSTRFLLSNEDFHDLHGNISETEYLIEAYFKEPSMASDYQTAYEQHTVDLPKNGQAVTYAIIFLLSAMTDIMTAMVLFVISILLVLIALFCMKYTMLTSMEEEITEIGTMKAIGLPLKSIGNLYLGKMKILMAFGMIFGYLISLICFQYTSGHMSRTFGSQSLSWFALLIATLGSLLVYIIAIYYCKGILKNIKKVSAVDALVRGRGFGKEKRIKNSLHKSLKIPSTLLMALHEIRTEFSRFSLVIWVMVFVSCIIIIPVNIVHTMESKEFITYMGSNVHDVLIEIEPGNELTNRYRKLENLLMDEENITYHSLQRVRMVAIDAKGNKKSIHIDSGENAGVGLQYLKGNAPSNENEIALSKLEAEQLGKTIGDSLVLHWENNVKIFTIRGVYQDVTSGGMTAKATYTFDGAAPEQYTFMVDIQDHNKQQKLVENWRYFLGNGYSVEKMDEFISQTLGGIVSQILSATWVAMGIGISLTALVVLLFIKLRLARSASQIVIQKAMGISTKRLRMQELYQVLITASIGIICGAAFANCFGDYFVSILFSATGLGIEKIKFLINPMVSWVLIPLLILVFAGSFCWIGSKKIDKMSVLAHMNG